MNKKYPFRLAGRRLYVPGVGTLPYIRGLQLLKKGDRYTFKAKLGDSYCTWIVYGEDYRTPLLEALAMLERNLGALQTCKNLHAVERSDKQNPTGYVGVFKTKSSYMPYQVTCPEETNELTGSLMRAVNIREQAKEEYLRKHQVSLRQVLSQASLG